MTSSMKNLTLLQTSHWIARCHKCSESQRSGIDFECFWVLVFCPACFPCDVETKAFVFASTSISPIWCFHPFVYVVGPRLDIQGLHQQVRVWWPQQPATHSNRQPGHSWAQFIRYCCLTWERMALLFRAYMASLARRWCNVNQWFMIFMENNGG